jgi:hypothetical protein
MRLYNRAANRQAHPHASRLRRVEGIEDPIDVFTVNSGTGIRNGDQNPIGFTDACLDLQYPRPGVRSTHGLDSIHDQIEENLLQLRLIAQRFGFRSVRECRLDRDIILLQFMNGERKNIPYQVIDVERPTLAGFFSEH